MKKILFVLLINIFFHTLVFADGLIPNTAVAVMDFGFRPGAMETSINIDHAGEIAADYVIERLVDGDCFQVIDKDVALERLREKKLKVTGLINPADAKRIGELLKVKYLVYGYVSGMSVSNISGGMVLLSNGLKVDVCTVKAHIIGRVIDVKTGMIVKAMKGDGVSRSSHTEVGVAPHVIKVGTRNVTQASVHNALQKAADNMVLDLLLSFEGKSSRVKIKKRSDETKRKGDKL